MSNPNIESEVQKCLKDLMHIRSRVVPVKVGKEVVSSVRQNFRSVASTEPSGSAPNDRRFPSRMPQDPTVRCSPRPPT